MNPLLFVYGTLMSGCENHHLLAGRGDFSGSGRMLGRLYLVDGYPGLVEPGGPTELVTGELWRVGPDRFGDLDELEGCRAAPPLFIRVSRPALSDRGETLSAWVYLYARPTTDLRLIPSGNWRTYGSEER